jgi:hypothetical protein
MNLTRAQLAIYIIILQKNFNHLGFYLEVRIVIFFISFSHQNTLHNKLNGNS